MKQSINTTFTTRQLSKSIFDILFKSSKLSLAGIGISGLSFFSVQAYADVLQPEEKADDTPSATLPAITITSNTSDGGFSTQETMSSTGLSVSLKELPQSISTVTSSQIDEQNIKTMDYALAQSTGVSNQIYGSNGSGYNYFFARGNKIRNFQLDGVPTNDVLANMGNLSTAPYERIEVVRGVSGLLDGTGNTSATVNLVRKHPTTSPQAQVSVGVGSRNTIALQSDISGSLTDDDTVTGRLVVSGIDADTWRKREHTRAGSIYGVLDYHVNSDTKLTTGISYDKTSEDASASHSTATYDNQGYATKLGVDHNPAADWAYSDTSTSNIFIGIDHYFNNNLNGKLEYNFTQHKFDHPHAVAGILSINHDTGATDMISGYWKGEPKTHSVSASLNGDYKMFGRDHEFVVGLNGFNYKSNRHGERSLGVIDSIYNDSSIANYGQPSSYQMVIRDDSEKQQFGGYIATNIHPSSNLSLLLGGRYSDFDYQSYDRRQKKMVGVDGSEFTPYTGIVYDLHDNLSAYASYTQLFIPQSQKDVNGTFVKPITGSNLELGLKGSWYFDRLNASLSIYQAKKDNLAVKVGQHADGEAYYQTTDHSKTTGWEVDLTGDITPYWQIQTGYTQALNRDSDGNLLNTEGAPKQTFKLFTSYDFAHGEDKGWQLGAGVRWQSETHSENIFGKFSDEAKARALDNAKQPAYAVVDLMAGYRLNEHNSFMLNVDNVFDKEYRTQPDRHSYGKERTIMGTWRYNF